MADHEQDTGIDQLLCCRLRLPDTAGIVGVDEPDGMVEHPAALVEVLDRQVDGDPMAGPGRGKGPAERGGEADPDLVCGPGFVDGQDQQDGEQKFRASEHGALPLAATKDQVFWLCSYSKPLPPPHMCEKPLFNGGIAALVTALEIGCPHLGIGQELGPAALHDHATGRAST